MGNKDAVSLMLGEMKERYGEEFTFKTICDGQLGSPYMAILTSCKRFPGAEIRAEIYWEENGKWEVTDDYLCYYMREEVQEIAAAAIEKVYGECKVYYIPASIVIPAKYTIEMSAEEFLSKNDILNKIYIYLPPEAAVTEKEAKIKLLQKELKEKGYAFKGVLCYISQADFYQEISESSALLAYTDKDCVAETGFFLQDPTESDFAYLRWQGQD